MEDEKGELVPEIRFKGFSDNWIQRAWVDTVNISTNMVDPKTGEYDELPHIGPGNIESFSGQLLNNVKTVKDDKLISGKFYFQSGDVIYGKINPQLAKYIHTDFEGLCSADAYVLNSKNDLEQDFLFRILQSKPFYDYSVSVSQRTGMPKINRDELNQFSFFMPSSHEQTAIGNFFRTLDDTISIYKRKLDKLKELKKGYLQQMFPQSEENVPQVRFAGFSESWEQRKLGEFGSVAMNKRIFKNQTSETGEVPFYKIGTFGSEADAYISRELFEEYKAKYPHPQKGDILISASGSIGRTVEFTGKDEYFQDSNIVWFNHDDRLNNSFLKCFYSIVKWAGIEGSTIKRLYNDNILNTIISLPILEEQTAIGNFFCNLDEQIATQQTKLNKLKQLKAAYLQKMFV